jgi:hypothetical protein
MNVNKREWGSSVSMEFVGDQRCVPVEVAILSF